MRGAKLKRNFRCMKLGEQMHQVWYVWSNWQRLSQKLKTAKSEFAVVTYRWVTLYPNTFDPKGWDSLRIPKNPNTQVNTKVLFCFNFANTCNLRQRPSSDHNQSWASSIIAELVSRKEQGQIQGTLIKDSYGLSQADRSDGQSPLREQVISAVKSLQADYRRSRCTRQQIHETVSHKLHFIMAKTAQIQLTPRNYIINEFFRCLIRCWARIVAVWVIKKLYEVCRTLPWETLSELSMGRQSQLHFVGRVKRRNVTW